MVVVADELQGWQRVGVGVEIRTGWVTGGG